MDIRVNKVNLVKSENASALAFTSITIDNLFTINDIRYMNGEKSNFFVMPSYKGKDDKYYSLVKLPEEVEKEVAKAIFAAYEQVQKGATLEVPETDHKAAQENVKDVNVFVKENKHVSISYKDIYFNGSHLVALKDNPENLFMAMPSKSRVKEDGSREFSDIYYIPDKDARATITSKAIENYNHFFNKQEQGNDMQANQEAEAEDEEEDEER